MCGTNSNVTLQNPWWFPCLVLYNNKKSIFILDGVSYLFKFSKKKTTLCRGHLNLKFNSTRFDHVESDPVTLFIIEQRVWNKSDQFFYPQYYKKSLVFSPFLYPYIVGRAFESIENPFYVSVWIDIITFQFLPDTS